MAAARAATSAVSNVSAISTAMSGGPGMFAPCDGKSGLILHGQNPPVQSVLMTCAQQSNVDAQSIRHLPYAQSSGCDDVDPDFSCDERPDAEQETHDGEGSEVFGVAGVFLPLRRDPVDDAFDCGIQGFDGKEDQEQPQQCDQFQQARADNREQDDACEQRQDFVAEGRLFPQTTQTAERVARGRDNMGKSGDAGRDLLGGRLLGGCRTGRSCLSHLQRRSARRDAAERRVASGDLDDHPPDHRREQVTRPKGSSWRGAMPSFFMVICFSKAFEVHRIVGTFVRDPAARKHGALSSGHAAVSWWFTVIGSAGEGCFPTVFSSRPSSVSTSARSVQAMVVS